MSGTWNYSGDPAKDDKDHVRFLIGDTCKDDPLVLDKEVDFAISQQTTLKLAAAVLLRSLAAKFSREVSTRVGDISLTNVAAKAKAFADRADEMDPDGITLGKIYALPSFGGLTISGKQALAEDDNAVQPSFEKGMDDIPGGPDEQGTTTRYDEDY